MIVTIPEVLREKLGADGAEALAQLLKRSAWRKRDSSAGSPMSSASSSCG